ncbi:hypothetical protein GCM10011349_47050 [Novosphingobium indicum]|uniref:ABC transmembrane type-1 domain-containing protein n=1 Tax=Novosphingobium indicum TaxID=462949 RepID=A0ABQ2K0N1_9SPHN|nr:ABC transporter permease subunit [Novosphingobium indicum]GGN62922.1 hypothetical protein GCM10011349_47050 [Novosphingobium indicum]
MMRQATLTLLALALVLFALLPLIVLLLASGLPDLAVRPEGIAWEAFRHWKGPRLSLLWDPSNDVMWVSLWRTTWLALSASMAASTLAIVAAYLATRQRSRFWRRGTQFLSLVAYGLPSIFLLIAYQPYLLELPIEPLARVWLLHFLYLLPMCSILTIGYAESYPHLLDRSAAIDGAGWGERFKLAYQGNLWRGHLAVTCIGTLISWGDIVISQQLLSGESKLLVDLYILRYFQNDSTFPSYTSAALFSLVLGLIAIILAFIIAATNRRSV